MAAIYSSYNMLWDYVRTIYSVIMCTDKGVFTYVAGFKTEIKQQTVNIVIKYVFSLRLIKAKYSALMLSVFDKVWQSVSKKTND